LKVSAKFIFVLLVLVAIFAMLYMTTTSRQRASGIAYSQGWLAYRFKDYEKAINHFNRSYRADKENLMAYYFASRSKMMLAEESSNPGMDRHYFREAASDCNELIKLGEEKNHKNLHLFFYVKARSHLNLKEFDSAAKAVEEARNLVPDDYNVLVLAGRVMIGKKEYDKAITYLKQAADVKTFKAYEAYFYLGQSFEMKGNTDKAWYYYDQCIKSWPPREVKQEAIRRKTEIVSKPSSQR
jgi:tetratricopeptide (TPR) repeat protein